MNRRNYLHSAVMLFTPLLLATAPSSASADLVTFEGHGHMIDAQPPDLAIGDKFVADYTFDSSAPVDSIDVGPVYNAVVSWHVDFDNGIRLTSQGSPTGYIEVWNNAHQEGDPRLSDRYSATLNANPDVTLPSGQGIGYLQVQIDDFTPADNPDLLSNTLLPSTPPNIALSDGPFGRFVFFSINAEFQRDFEEDSITVVPEPTTAILAITGLGLLLASKVQRVGGFAVC